MPSNQFVVVGSIRWFLQHAFLDFAAPAYKWAALRGGIFSMDVLAGVHVE
jgi:hypothetical protein